VRLLPLQTLVLSLLLALGCSSANPSGSDAPTLLTSADDTVSNCEDGLTGSVPIGSTLQTTTAVNFRSGPGTSYSIYRVLPESTTVVSVNSTSSSNNFYNVEQQGIQGWIHGKYLSVTAEPDQTESGPVDSVGRQMVLSTAAASVGFSYWWGHGRFDMSGPTDSTKGSCTGSCPNCSHSGDYGSDCSGMVAKAWNVPSSNIPDVDSHPYSTSDFVNDTPQWYTVNRSSLNGGDALVYNSNGEGHVVIYDTGDGWGDMWLYECRGCSSGCVHDLRSLSAVYHGIRRQGL